MKFKIIQSQYGKNLIVIKNKNIETVTFFFQFKVGTINENAKTKGITHFLEHMIYKGNKKYKDGIQIIQKFNEIGASENATNLPYTTTYYCKVHKDYQKQAFDLIKLCIFDSIFPSKELERERNVISEELLKRRQDPEIYVSDLMESSVFGGTPYESQKGLEKNVNKISRKDVIHFWKKYYNLNNCIVVMNGNIQDSIINDFVKVKTPIINSPSPIVTYEDLKKLHTSYRINIDHRKLGQTSISMAYPTFGYTSNLFYVMSLINVILNYRLFINIRSKEGLVYGVNSVFKYYDRCGYISIECSFDKKNISKVVNIIFDTIHTLKTKKITRKILNDHIRYFINKRKMVYENTVKTCEIVAEQYLHIGNIETVEQIEKKMNKISETDIMNLAKEIFNNQRLNFCIIGHHIQKEIETLI